MKSTRSRYHGHRFPPEIIGYAVWVYHRFCLSFRDVEDLLAERGIIVSYEIACPGKRPPPVMKIWVVVRSNEDLCCMKREKAAKNGNGA